jgi:hypothetical protein
MSEEAENLIKSTCRALGITYRELGERIGYSESAIKNAATSVPSEPMQKAISLYLRNVELETQVQEYQNFKDFLKKVVK